MFWFLCSFLCEGAFVPKRRIHCLHLPVQPLMSLERAKFKSRLCLIQSKAVNLVSSSQVTGAVTVTGFCDSDSSGVVRRDQRTLPRCSRKQDSCLLFSTDDDYVIKQYKYRSWIILRCSVKYQLQSLFVVHYLCFHFSGRADGWSSWHWQNNASESCCYRMWNNVLQCVFLYPDI